MNSSNNKISYLLHKYFYRIIIRHNIKYISKIYYPNENSKRFVDEMYGINDEKYNMEFMPLGGEMADLKRKVEKQNEYKKNEGINQNTIIFMHSGKMNKLKRTLEVLDAFISLDKEEVCLLLIDCPSDDISEEFYKKVNSDKRIHYLGWMTNDKLMDYLFICDVYLQPGSPSVTAHEAMCKGCTVILSSDGNFYKDFIDNNSALYLTEKYRIVDAMDELSSNPSILCEYKKNGYNTACRLFDYKIQSELITK